MLRLLSVVLCVVAPLQEPRSETMLAHRALADASTAAVRADAPLVSYRAVRKLNAENPRYKLTGWMEARTEFDQTTGLRFEITGEGGSGQIRNKVLRKVLEGERDAIADGEGTRAGLTAENYSFGAAEATGPGLLRIRLTPRRKDRLLVDGHMIVTADDHDLVRVEGRLAKNPSFWTRHVLVVRTD
ncbi:MAG: hypothetical protein M3545_12675 [Acidobacteriota bacterium]|nr:hypothetical protein [Acidobacteriota bacterium]